MRTLHQPGQPATPARMRQQRSYGAALKPSPVHLRRRQGESQGASVCGSVHRAPLWRHSRTLAHARVLTARLRHQRLGDAITGGCWRISVLGTQAFRGRGALPLARQCAPVARSGWVKGRGWRSTRPEIAYGRCPGWPFPTASTYGARSSASSTSRLSVPDSFAV
jgi:hypothetical protein